MLTGINTTDASACSTPSSATSHAPVNHESLGATRLQPSSAAQTASYWPCTDRPALLAAEHKQRTFVRDALGVDLDELLAHRPQQAA